MRRAAPLLGLLLLGGALARAQSYGEVWWTGIQHTNGTAPGNPCFLYQSGGDPTTSGGKVQCAPYTPPPNPIVPTSIVALSGQVDAVGPIGSPLITEIDQMGATSGQVMTWNGTAWAPVNPTGGVTSLAATVPSTVSAATGAVTIGTLFDNSTITLNGGNALQRGHISGGGLDIPAGSNTATLSGVALGSLANIAGHTFVGNPNPGASPPQAMSYPPASGVLEMISGVPDTINMYQAGVGNVAFGTTSGQLTDSTQLFFDSGTIRLGVGTSGAPSAAGHFKVTGTPVNGIIVAENTASGTGDYVELGLINNLGIGARASWYMTSSNYTGTGQHSAVILQNAGGPLGFQGNGPGSMGLYITKNGSNVPGDIQIRRLSAGGVVKASAVTDIDGNASGQLAIAAAGTDFAPTGSCAAHNFVTATNAASLTCAQPAFTDISGTIGCSQLPATATVCGSTTTYGSTGTYVGSVTQDANARLTGVTTQTTPLAGALNYTFAATVSMGQNQSTLIYPLPAGAPISNTAAAGTAITTTIAANWGSSSQSPPTFSLPPGGFGSVSCGTDITFYSLSGTNNTVTLVEAMYYVHGAPATPGNWHLISSANVTLAFAGSNQRGTLSFNTNSGSGLVSGAGDGIVMVLYRSDTHSTTNFDTLNANIMCWLGA